MIAGFSGTKGKIWKIDCDDGQIMWTFLLENPDRFPDVDQACMTMDDAGNLYFAGRNYHLYSIADDGGSVGN